jgi:type IV secretory pathway VirB10-like protein
MRLSAFFSLVAHVSVVAAGLWVSQGEAYKPEPSTPMIVIPLELMTIGEVTDIAPVVADAPKEEEAAAVEEVTETFTSASAPKPAEDVVNLEAAPPPPPPKKEEVKKQEAKPAPAKKEEDLNSFLDSMLTDVKKDKPKAAPARRREDGNRRDRPGAHGRGRDAAHAGDGAGLHPRAAGEQTLLD